MKESADASDRPETQAQIDEHISQLAALGATYATVNTPMDNPARYAMWVSSIRAHGMHVWHRPFPWKESDGTFATHDPATTPSDYLKHLHDFIVQNPTFFQPGDILDGYAESDNMAYWKQYPSSDWWNGANGPTSLSPVCSQWNQFLVNLATTADSALSSVGATGVNTRIRSVTPWYATAWCLADSTIASLGGYLTVDAYFADSSTDPAYVAGQADQAMESWHSFRPSAKIVFGEYGYSNDLQVDDTTQSNVVSAVLERIASKPYVYGLNYWVGAGGPGYGGYTNILTGRMGNWTPRPAAFQLASFFASHP
jgi:hypothetical protein